MKRPRLRGHFRGDWARVRRAQFMAGKTVVKSIVVPGKLVNIVVK
ncbi:hypothetical protein [Fibrobacter sp. UWB4]|nr:hypothetical protein [Fibrobacter sp. UWB4]